MILSKISKNCWWNIKYAIIGSLIGLMVGLFIIPNDNLLVNFIILTSSTIAIFTVKNVFTKECSECDELFEYSKCNKDYMMYRGYMQVLQCVTGINCITIFLLQ